MKTITNLIVTMILAVSAYGIISWHPSEKESEINADQSKIVLLKFKAQAEKEDQAIAEFNKLLEKVKHEPNFVSIKLHVDPNDNTNIMLYEEWEDIDYYNGEHMNTTHLKEFMAKSENFLAGPPEITFWEVKNIFE